MNGIKTNRNGGGTAKCFATVCSGIGAPEVACGTQFGGLGWNCLFSSEIEAFPNAVRQHHFPEAPNFGDMTKFAIWPTIDELNKTNRSEGVPPTERRFRNGRGCLHASGLDVLIAGTPCQSFSVAGLRAGLADPRGNLTLTFLGIVERYAPRWVLWENVPGALSSVATGHPPEMAAPDDLREGEERECVEDYEADSSHAISCFMDGLKQLGYGCALAILDAQYFGVAQRRRRVFVVGHSGGLWQRAAAVLFDRESLCGNPAPRREKGKGTAHSLAPSLGASGRGFERAGETRGQDPVVACENGGRAQAPEVSRPILGKGNSSHDETQETYITEKCANGARPEGQNYATHHGRTAGNNGAPCGEPPDAEGKMIATEFRPSAIGIDSEMNAHHEVAGPLNHLSPSGGGHPPAVAIGIDGGEVGFALRSNPSHSGDKGDGGVNTTMVAEVSPTLRIQNRNNSNPVTESSMLVCEPSEASGGEQHLAAGNDAKSVMMRNREGCDGGGKGPLLSEEKSLTLAANANDQVLFQTLPSATIAHALKGEGFDASEDGTGRGTPLTAEKVFRFQRTDRFAEDSIASPLAARDFKDARDLVTGMAVRRLTPRECERLQGFPDDFTRVNFRNKPACDGPRYKALGNSMAVPVIRWICSRMDLVDELVPLNNQ